MLVIFLIDMRYIGNILTSDPFDGGALYNVTGERDLLTPGIPTLIVGWEKTKEMYPEASIIEFEVDKDVYWTYGKYEKRDKFEENVKKFYDLTIKRLKDAITYTFYDVLVGSGDKFISFLSFISNSDKKVVYLNNDMAYIYNGKNLVVGVSLRDCDYSDCSLKKRFFSALYENKENIVLVKNSDDVLKSIRYKIRGKEYIIPYLFQAS